MMRLRTTLLLAGVLLLAGCFLPSPPPMGPGILFEDDFEGATTDWFVDDNPLRHWWVEGGQYHVVVRAPDQAMTSWRDHMGPFANFQLDIDAEQISGPTANAYGVLFRVVDDDNYYRFRISGDGSLGLEKKVAGQFVSLIPWLISYSINQGDAVNHITIIADGDKISYALNGEAPYTVTDSQFPAGEVGVMAALYASPGEVHIAFDNLVVQELP